MEEKSENTYLPVCLNITDKRIVVVGGGRVGLHKSRILLRFTNNVTVVSPCFREDFETLPFTLVRKKYDKTDIRRAFLVYACTEDDKLNRQIKEDAEALGVLVSVCDNPALCDFVSPAIYREDNLCVAVSSNARDVRRSIRVRDRIRQLASEDEELLA